MSDLDAIKARLARVAGKWPTKGVLAPGADDFGPKAWSAHGPLRCHATARGRDRQWRQANADADFIAAAPTDIAALVAEVERLRAERDHERAAVAAYFRARASAPHPTEAGERLLSPLSRGLMSLMADRIERGEHVADEE